MGCFGGKLDWARWRRCACLFGRFTCKLAIAALKRDAWLTSDLTNLTGKLEIAVMEGKKRSRALFRRGLPPTSDAILPGGGVRRPKTSVLGSGGAMYRPALLGDG